YTLEFVEPNNWQLVIKAAEEADQGHYECQVSSHPPKIRRVFLFVYVPRLEIFDARGEAIQEKFYEVGSGIDLRCTAFHVPRDSVVWSRDGARIYHTPDAGISIESNLGPSGIVSWLRVKAAAVLDGECESACAACFLYRFPGGHQFQITGRTSERGAEGIFTPRRSLYLCEAHSLFNYHSAIPAESQGREFSGYAAFDQHSIRAKSPPVSFTSRPSPPAQRVLLQPWHSLRRRLLLKALRSHF
ncbi:hypothetical protein C7M84_004393, partial [Penaeus vannamei]